MTIDDLLKSIKDKLGDKILSIDKRSYKRAYVAVHPKDIVDASQYLFNDMGFRFNIASCLDEFNGLEILYHFSFDRSGVIITIRTMITDKNDPRIGTITKVTRSAWWIEREIHELFGVIFEGNDDLRPLLLADDWPKDVYPMRKNFVVPKRDSRKI